MFPDIITNDPSYIELQIFVGETEHLPFYVKAKPSSKTTIKVKKIYKNGTYKEYYVDRKYLFRFNDLLKDQGITIFENKYSSELLSLE